MTHLRWAFQLLYVKLKAEGMRKFKSDSYAALTLSYAHNYAKYNEPIT